MWSRARLRFLATTCMIVVARALDAWTTWLATPNLALEANPLERLLHLGWWGMLVMNAIVVALVAFAAWHAAFRAPPLPAEAGLDQEAFVGRYWFSSRERHTRAQAMLWLPADRRVRWAFIGGPGAALVIAGSLVAAGWNLLVARRIVVAHTAGVVGIAIFWGAVLAGLGVAVHVFLRRAYRRYSRTATGEPAT
ncbi:MAG: hypothetical protein ABI205_10440 [Gemmatimonadaceae bacterium]